MRKYTRLMETIRRFGESYPCAKCGALFVLRGPRGKFCQECRANRKKDGLGVRLECERCGTHYRLGYAGVVYENNKRSAPFLVEGMWTAEFAFKVIMERQGILLNYNGRNGATFELDDSFIRPDFHLPGTCTYYEVCSTNAIYMKSKRKYARFRKRYAGITLIVVRPDGTGLV